MARGVFCCTPRAKTASRVVVLENKGAQETAVNFVLWLIAVILVVAGIVTLFRGALAYGIVLIVLGFLVGPGGVSIFT